MEVMAEGREWMRQRLQQKLQEEALNAAPVVHRRQRAMRVRTGVGVIELRVWHGQDRRTKLWGCPMRERWGFSPHQVLSPWLQERLAFTVTQMGSYEDAAAMARRGYAAADDSSLHALTQRLGAQAEAQTQQRLKELPQEREPKGPASELAVFMKGGLLGAEERAHPLGVK